MSKVTRRDFFSNMGKGMLIAGLGSVVAEELGAFSAWANESQAKLNFGKLEPLVARLQETPIAKLQPYLVNHLKSGTYDLRQLVAAASLANARKFGGDDYVGYHTLMALAPAYQISQELPSSHSPLPVFKVLYRNTDHIQKEGGGTDQTLYPVTPAQGSVNGKMLRTAILQRNMPLAEARFATLVQASPENAFNQLQLAVQDDVEVHRVVLAHRAWSLLDLVGIEHAHTLLREAVRFCVNAENRLTNRGLPAPEIRTLLPKLLDEYKLHDGPAGKRRADDAWVIQLSETVYKSSRADAATAVASALSEGYHFEDVGEALSLAATQLQLCDSSRRVHGASSGVHASDSVHAWRSIARVCNPRNKVANMIVGAYHICKEGRYGHKTYPFPEHRSQDLATDPAGLLAQTEQAIRANDQGLTCAAVARYGDLDLDPGPVFNLMRAFALSEDGRLHGEKYYITVKETFAASRPSFRWRHLVGLARATASGYGFSVDDQPGFRAPGYEEARRLLHI